MPLQELRRARELTQTTLAELLHTSQPEVSRMEHQADMYVSTLRRYVEAMGGALEIVARFPDGAVEITQFHELTDEESDEPSDQATATV
jgi:transcriptional regulator with XRE-family HTH domain